MDPVAITRALTREVQTLDFAPPVAHVYNPLVYARANAETFIERYLQKGVQTLLLGMNPGPYGMAQTGVPFGEVAAVRDWLGISEPVRKPEREHPRRPILGMDCPRSEVSGRRLWGWAAERFGTPEAFFEKFFVWNYCPLVFLEEGGRNRTPDKLPAAERDALFAACDRALVRLVQHVQPRWVLGVGRFAEGRARAALAAAAPEVQIGTILHPSPASPIANRGWAPQVEAQLEKLGLGN
jgi:single-strand selective monofunctional uracil DNA glycosylase